MARTLSWNVNGIRACLRHGFVDFLNNLDADVVGLQEVRATSTQIPQEIIKHASYPYQFYFEAEKKGYSGVALLAKETPKEVVKGIGVADFDREGRVITGVFSDFIYLSAYFPNSQDGGKRLSYKLEFCKALEKWLTELEKTYPGKALVLAGDFNIAHEEIDLARPHDNHESPGFLPEERAWMKEFLTKEWADSFRLLYPEAATYSWWSARTRARERNIGWRIDYHALRKVSRSGIKEAEILGHVLGSDHCPVTVTFK